MVPQRTWNYDVGPQVQHNVHGYVKPECLHGMHAVLGKYVNQNEGREREIDHACQQMGSCLIQLKNLIIMDWLFSIKFIMN